MSAAAVAQRYRGLADLPRRGASVRLSQDPALLLTRISPSGDLLQHLYLLRCGPHFHFHSTYTLPVSYLALYSKLRGGECLTHVDTEGHYRFTAEELDFILNYDIKYRLGRDAGSEDE